MWFRIITSIVLVIVLLWIGGQVFEFLASFKTEPPRDEPVAPALRVEVYRTEQAPLQRIITGFGVARADRQAVISAEVAGRVTEAERLKIGRLVRGPEIEFDQSGKSSRKPAETIVQIDPQTYQERVRQAELQVEEVTVELERLNQEEAASRRLLAQERERLATITGEYNRMRTLYQQGAGSEKELRRTELEYQQYREQLIRLENDLSLYPVRREQLTTRRQAAESALALSRQELEKATVRAPFSGVLSQTFIEEGQYARPGEPLVEITDLQHIEIPVPVSLADAATIAKLLSQGESPLAELAAREEAFVNPADSTIWTGRVRRIAPTADELTRTIEIYVEVDNEEHPAPLQPGTFVHARIEGDVVPAEQGIFVPRDALVGNTLYVAAGSSETSDADDVRAEPRTVRVSRRIQSLALVTDGLDVGEKVVMTNLDIIGAGTRLEIMDNHSLDDELARLRLSALRRPAP